MDRDSLVGPKSCGASASAARDGLGRIEGLWLAFQMGKQGGPQHGNPLPLGRTLPEALSYLVQEGSMQAPELEVGVLHDMLMEGQIGMHADDHVLPQSPPHPLNGLGAV